MNAAAREMAQVLDRDLAQLRGEVEAYPDDASLWRLHPGIFNSGGGRARAPPDWEPPALHRSGVGWQWLRPRPGCGVRLTGRAPCRTAGAHRGDALDARWRRWGSEIWTRHSLRRRLRAWVASPRPGTCSCTCPGTSCITSGWSTITAACWGRCAALLPRNRISRGDRPKIDRAGMAGQGDFSSSSHAPRTTRARTIGPTC